MTTEAGQLECREVRQELVKHEHHPNAAEDGETANIKQNTTNKGAAGDSVDRSQTGSRPYEQYCSDMHGAEDHYA